TVGPPAHQGSRTASGSLLPCRDLPCPSGIRRVRRYRTCQTPRPLPAQLQRSCDGRRSRSHRPPHSPAPSQATPAHTGSLTAPPPRPPCRKPDLWQVVPLLDPLKQITGTLESLRAVRIGGEELLSMCLVPSLRRRLPRFGGLPRILDRLGVQGLAGAPARVVPGAFDRRAEVRPPLFQGFRVGFVALPG